MSIHIEQVKNTLIDQFSQLNEDAAYEAADVLIDAGVSESEIEACLNEGMKKVGSLFESGEYFIADLMFSGMIYCTILDRIRPKAAPSSAGVKGKGPILVGVVEKDIHDIGKDIIVSLLTADGFDVVDLGVDVAPETFVSAIRQYQPRIVSLSGMMSFALDSMTRTLSAIEEAGLRDQIRIIIGGGCVAGLSSDMLNVDLVSYDPADTLSFCNQILSGE